MPASGRLPGRASLDRHFGMLRAVVEQYCEGYMRRAAHDSCCRPEQVPGQPPTRVAVSPPRSEPTRSYLLAEVANYVAAASLDLSPVGRVNVGRK